MCKYLKTFSFSVHYMEMFPVVTNPSSHRRRNRGLGTRRKGVVLFQRTSDISCIGSTALQLLPSHPTGWVPGAQTCPGTQLVVWWTVAQCASSRSPYRVPETVLSCFNATIPLHVHTNLCSGSGTSQQAQPLTKARSHLCATTLTMLVPYAGQA